MDKMCGLSFLISLVMRWKRFRAMKVDDVEAIPSANGTSIEVGCDVVNTSLCLHNSESDSSSDMTSISRLLVGSYDSSLIDVFGHPLKIEDLFLHTDRKMMSCGSARHRWEFLRAIPKDSSSECEEIFSVYEPAAENEIEESILPLSPDLMICKQVIREQEHQNRNISVIEKEVEDGKSMFEEDDSFFFGEESSFECAGHLASASPTTHYALGGSYISSERSDNETVEEADAASIATAEDS